MTDSTQRQLPGMAARYCNWFGLICAYRLDGRGGAEPLTWKDLEPPRAEEIGRSAFAPSQTEPIWVHLDARHNQALHWLRAHSGLDPMIQEALIAARVSPRFEEHESAMLVILKGLNFAPGALPMDLVALRLWSDGRRIITCRREHERATGQLRRNLEAGVGATDAGSLIAALADSMVADMEELIIEQVEATRQIGRLGDAKPTEDLVAELAQLRRVMIWMRRSLVPQRRALARLAASRLPWVGPRDRATVREIAHQCMDYVEGLAAAEQIGEITQDEICSARPKRPSAGSSR